MLKIFTVHILFRYKIILEIGNSFEKTILLDILLNIRVYTYYAQVKHVRHTTDIYIIAFIIYLCSYAIS